MRYQFFIEVLVFTVSPRRMMVSQNEKSENNFVLKVNGNVKSSVNECTAEAHSIGNHFLCVGVYATL